MPPDDPDAAGVLPRSGSANHDGNNPRPHPDFSRHIIRLFQCRLCSILRNLFVSLPCGRSICRDCLPRSYVRDWITYPSAPDRHRVIQCPFTECGRVHAVKDCSSDVTLNKLIATVHTIMERVWREAVRVGLLIEYDGISELIPDKYRSDLSDSDISTPFGENNMFTFYHRFDTARVTVVTRFLQTWAFAARRLLPYNDVQFNIQCVYDATTGSPIAPKAEEFDINVLKTLQQTLRSEVDCQICFCLLYDPYTTPCGHTFCRHCLLKAYDRRDRCPLCRRPLGIDPLLKADVCPSNDRIAGYIRTFWQDELDSRAEAYIAEGIATRHLTHIPLLVCGLSFPGQPMYVQIFEPQYHRMLENVMNGNGKFGMVMPLDPERLGDGFHPIGVLHRVKNTWYRRDGRSLVELEGLCRFRVLNSYMHQGYTVGVSERADDVGVEQEEAMEAAEVGYDASDSAAGGHLYQYYDTRDEEAAATAPFWTSWRQFGSDMPECAIDLNAMTTESLLRFALSFVDRMQEKKVPWLTEAKLMTYGECPADPVLLPWWLGSTIPISNPQKVRLISAFTVRDRLKICGSWIMEIRRRTR
ncbi:hypothetical protein CP532_1770 [Ophiocordyceps camponoti-leonardi (nom. inval.)]|nr:hypothetical protein CP532_1770 [Ophiocordyceps camponoti-leonardi (nom. inval.)]